MIHGQSGSDAFWAQQALAFIKETYGDTCLIKPKPLLKFGNTINADADIKTTVMRLPGASQYHETYITTNGIDTFSSDNASDSGKTLVVEGHTRSGNALTFVTQTATCLGTTKATLTTPLNRVTRWYSTQARGSEFVGAMYFYEDDTTTTPGIPDTDTKVHLYSVAGSQKSQKGATAFSNVDYGLITQLVASVTRSAGNTVSVDIELEIGEMDKSFLPVLPPLDIRNSSTSLLVIPLRPFIVVPKNADARVVATSNTNDTIVSAGFNALLAKVI